MRRGSKQIRYLYSIDGRALFGNFINGMFPYDNLQRRIARPPDRWRGRSIFVHMLLFLRGRSLL